MKETRNYILLSLILAVSLILFGFSHLSIEIDHTVLGWVVPFTSFPIGGRRMAKKRVILFGAVIGASVGYLILPPFAMVISDYVHHVRFGTPFGSFIEVFKGEMLLWALAFTTFGGAVGAVIGHLFARVMERG